MELVELEAREFNNYRACRIVPGQRAKPQISSVSGTPGRALDAGRIAAGFSRPNRSNLSVNSGGIEGQTTKDGWIASSTLKIY